MKKISVIGTGRVAYHFINEILSKDNLKLIKIIGRSKKIKSEFNKFKKYYSNDLSYIQKSDFCVLVISDNSITDVCKTIK